MEPGPQEVARPGRWATSSQEACRLCRMEGYRVSRLGGLKMPEQKDDHPLYAAVNATLANVAAACSPPPSWYEAWAGLVPQSSKEERLAVYLAVRAAGSVPADAGFFL